jgi:hypothetical protein
LFVSTCAALNDNLDLSCVSEALGVVFCFSAWICARHSSKWRCSRHQTQSAKSCAVLARRQEQHGFGAVDGGTIDESDSSKTKSQFEMTLKKLLGLG